MTHRQLKKQALSLLASDDLHSALKSLCAFPLRQIVNPLFGLLYHTDPVIRWRAVTAMGVVVSRMADENIESARVIMRRFMWNLNDESGGIGWGSPESMAEIMAHHERLACEFGCLVVSYADPEGNYLEHPTLQQGVLWGWGRLGRRYPELTNPRSDLLIPYLQSNDTVLQGLAAWAAEPLRSAELTESLNTLVSHTKQISIYVEDEFKSFTVGQLANSALARITA